MFPLILGALALGSGAMGVVNALGGVEKINKAEDRLKKFEALLNSKKKLVEKRWAKIEAQTDEFNYKKERFRDDLLVQLVSFFTQLELNGESLNRASIDKMLGFDISSLMDEYIHQSIKPLENSSIESLAGSVTTSLLATSAALGAANVVGFASTGTAIGSLSGAASWNATLAWLGGGSLAAGGGGMALGSLILGGVAIGPALCLGGIHLHNQGDEAAKQSYEFQEKVLLKVGEFYLILQEIRIISELITRLGRRLDDIGNEIKRDITKFKANSVSINELQSWWILISNQVRTIFDEPILIGDGIINPTLLKLVSLDTRKFIPDHSIVKFSRIQEMIQVVQNSVNNDSYSIKEKFVIQRAQAQCYEIAYSIIRWHEDHLYKGQKLNKNDSLDLSQLAYTAAIYLKDGNIDSAISTLQELETILADLKHHSDSKHDFLNQYKPILEMLEGIK